jgi:hypothetical protein
MERIKPDLLPNIKAPCGSYAAPEQTAEQLAAQHGLSPDFNKPGVSIIALQRRSSAIDILAIGTPSAATSYS